MVSLYSSAKLKSGGYVEKISTLERQYGRNSDERRGSGKLADATWVGLRESK